MVFICRFWQYLVNFLSSVTIICCLGESKRRGDAYSLVIYSTINIVFPLPPSVDSTPSEIRLGTIDFRHRICSGCKDYLCYLEQFLQDPPKELAKSRLWQPVCCFGLSRSVCSVSVIDQRIKSLKNRIFGVFRVVLSKLHRGGSSRSHGGNFDNLRWMPGSNFRTLILDWCYMVILISVFHVALCHKFIAKIKGFFLYL